MLSKAAGEVGKEADEGAGDDDPDADPDPVDEGIKEDLDDGAVGVGVLTLVDGIEVVSQGGVVGDNGGVGLAGLVEAFLRGEQTDVLVALVDVEQGELRLVRGVGVLREAPMRSVSPKPISCSCC